MPSAASTTELFLIAMGIILSVPFLIWRLGRTDYYAPLVVVQIVTGIILGPGVLGRAFPDYYSTIFNPAVVTALNGIAWWAVMVFVCIAGIELDLKQAWRHRRESGIAAGFALGTPLLFGAVAALGLLAAGGWIGPKAAPTGSSMWVPAGHQRSPNQAPPAITHTRWWPKWPWRRTIMPGLYSMNAVMKSGSAIGHFSRTTATVPSALRWRFTSVHSMSSIRVITSASPETRGTGRPAPTSPRGSTNQSASCNGGSGMSWRNCS